MNTRKYTECSRVDYREAEAAERAVLMGLFVLAIIALLIMVIGWVVKAYAAVYAAFPSAV